MSGTAVSIGDLTLHLDGVLERNEAWSRACTQYGRWSAKKAVVPCEQERRKFLRIQVLREVTLIRQAIGLEPWGRMKVEYEGLDAALP